MKELNRNGGKRMRPAGPRESLARGRAAWVHDKLITVNFQVTSGAEEALLSNYCLIEYMKE